MPVRFQPERPAPRRTGFLLCLPCLLAAVLLHDRADLWRLRSLTRNRTDGNNRLLHHREGEGGRPRPVFQSAHDGIQPLKTVAVQFFCGQGRLKNRRSDSDILRLPFRQRKNPPHTDIPPACYPDGGVFLSPHRPPCGLLLCAGGNQCL